MNGSAACMDEAVAVSRKGDSPAAPSLRYASIHSTLFGTCASHRVLSVASTMRCSGMRCRS
eukprot:2610506-Rhodomonas_salina.4